MLVSNKFIKVKEQTVQRNRSDKDILGFDPMMPMGAMSHDQFVRATAYLMTRQEERVRAERAQRKPSLERFIHKARIK